jgi:hypothetical protein
MTITLPAGETLPDVAGEGDLVLPWNVTCESSTIAKGVLVGERFVGDW